MGKMEWLTKLGWYGARIKHSTVGLGNNHETMIIVPSWSYDNHTVEIFSIVYNIIVNTVIIVMFTGKYFTWS